MKNADAIITLSKEAKNEIVDILKVNPDRVFVTYLGADKQYQYLANRNQDDDLLAKFKIPEQYLLYLGTLEPRKNIVRLVKAFYEYKKNYQTDVKLVLSGSKGWRPLQKHIK